MSLSTLKLTNSSKARYLSGLFSQNALGQDITTEFWQLLLCYNHEDTRDREGHSSEPVLSGRDDQNISVTLMPCTAGVDSMHIFITYCDDKSSSGRHDFLVSRLREGLKLSFDWVFI